MGVSLRLEAIAKAYGARRAVAGVTLEVQAGEAVLLVGRNGAGKTTLLRVATGYVDADAGEVVRGGRIGYLPEQAPAPGELAVREHLRLRARLKGVDADALDRAIERAGVAAVARQRIATLSKGFRQRVGLADALLGDPPVLVLDEPTSGLDPIQTRELVGELREAAKARAVLVSSHAVAELERVATRIAVMKAGELVAVGTREELCERAHEKSIEDAVVALMGGV